MKKRILYIGHLPPPVHGVAVINQWIYQSKPINDHFHLEFINLSFSSKIQSIGKFSFSKIIRMISVLMKIIKMRFSFRADIILYNNSPLGIAFWRDWLYSIVIKIIKPRSVELVFYIHGKGFGVFSNKSVAYKWAAKGMFRNTIALTLSPVLAEEFRVFRVKRIRWVPNGIPDDSGIPEKHAHQGVSFLFLSNFFSAKGVLDFIEALSIVKAKRPGKPFAFSLVGYEYDLSVEYLKGAIETRHLSENLESLGPLQGAGKHKIFRQSDVFVLPTHNDCFPLVLLEAFSFGLPAIGSRVGAIPEIIDHGINGFCIPPHDPEKLSNALLHFIDHPESIADFGTAARKKFLSTYSFDTFEANFIAAITAILDDETTKSKVTSSLSSD